MYPQHHGVTGNEVYDREKNKYFKYGFELFHYNESVTPIWTLNELQNNTSGVMMWAGGDFPYQGKNSTFIKAFDKEMTLEDRAKLIMSWLKDVEHPANFVMFYIEQPDDEGHAYGPDSINVFFTPGLIFFFFFSQILSYSSLVRVQIVFLDDLLIFGDEETAFKRDSFQNENFPPQTHQF